MARFAAILLCLLGLLWAASPVQAGWLKDKLKDVVEDVADKAIDEAADEAYEEGKEAMSQDEEGEEADFAGDDEDFDDESYMDEEEFDAGDDGYYTDEDQYFDGADMDGDSSPLARQCDKYGVTYGLDEDEDDDGDAALVIRDNLHFTVKAKLEDLTGRSAVATTSIYVDGTRLRYDISDGERTGLSMVALGPNPGDKIYSLYHTEKMYAVTPVTEDDKGIWVMTSKMEPCAGYRKASKLGTESMAGRRVMKWSCQDAEPADSVPDVFLWVDEELGVVVATEDLCHRTTLLSLTEGRPDSSLFEVPADYRELEIPAFPGKP